MLKKMFAVLLMIGLCGCAALQPTPRPETVLVELPEAYSMYAGDDPGPGQWWRSFGSAELDALVDAALSGNFDIRTAWSRLKQADALLRQAGADRMPTVDYSAGYEAGRQHTRNDDGDTGTSDSQTFYAGLGAAYEVDLWGRLDASKQSEVKEVEAAREDVDAAAVSVAAEVVDAWIDIIAVRQQITILRDQIRINENLLKLQQLRFANGQSSALDISQQREALTAAKAKLPLLQLSEQQQLNALAVLLGRGSANHINIARQKLPDLIPLPSLGLPADLLAARPDVRAAGLRLKAADWQVSAARANRLPAINLGADALFSSDSLGLLLNNWVATLAASLTGPLFDAGARSAEVARTKAVAEEALMEYTRTVIQAIQEVEDGLAGEKHQTEYIGLLEDRLKASRLALKDARIQYLNGQNNYLDYLSSWTSVQDLERQRVAEQAALLKYRVTLHRALGGDWTRELAPMPHAVQTNGTPAPAAATLNVCAADNDG